MVEALVLSVFAIAAIPILVLAIDMFGRNENFWQ